MLFFQKEDVTDPIEILTYGKGWAEIDYEVHFGLDIYDISPKMGSIVGGTEITISGSGFLPFEFEEEDKNWVIHSEYNIYFGYDPIFHLNVPDSPKRPDPWTSGWNRGYKCEVTEITNYQVKCVMPRAGPCAEFNVFLGWHECAQGDEMNCLCHKDESKLYSGVGYPAMFTNDHVGEIQLMDLEIIWNYQYPIIGRCAADEGNSSCTFEYSELATPQFSPIPENRVQNMVGGGSSTWDLYDTKMIDDVETCGNWWENRQALNHSFPYWPKAIGNGSLGGGETDSFSYSYSYSYESDAVGDDGRRLGVESYNTYEDEEEFFHLSSRKLTAESGSYSYSYSYSYDDGTPSGCSRTGPTPDWVKYGWYNCTYPDCDYAPHSSFSQNSTFVMGFGPKSLDSQHPIYSTLKGDKQVHCASYSWNRFDDMTIMKNFHDAPIGIQAGDSGKYKRFPVGSVTCHYPDVISPGWKSNGWIGEACLAQNPASCPNSTFDGDMNRISFHAGTMGEGIRHAHQDAHQREIQYSEMKIYSITPKRGSMYGGTWITIRGMNMVKESIETISFSGIDCVEIEYVSSEEWRCLTGDAAPYDRANTWDPYYNGGGDWFNDCTYSDSSGLHERPTCLRSDYTYALGSVKSRPWAPGIRTGIAIPGQLIGIDVTGAAKATWSRSILAFMKYGDHDFEYQPYCHSKKLVNVTTGEWEWFEGLHSPDIISDNKNYCNATGSGMGSHNYNVNRLAAGITWMGGQAALNYTYDVAPVVTSVSPQSGFFNKAGEER